MKDRTTAGLLAILLGGFGVHRFYLGQPGLGLLYLVFCLTCIPSLIGLIEGIQYLTMSQHDFDVRFNRAPGATGDVASELGRLHALHKEGALTATEYATQKSRLLGQVAHGGGGGKRVFAWILLGFAVIGAGVELDNFFSGRHHATGAGIAMIALFGIGAAALFRSAEGRAGSAAPAGHAEVASREAERAILQAAKKLGGKVTITDVAAESTLSFSEAKVALDQLAKAGACETQITDDGLIVYDFVELSRRKQLEAG